MFKDELEEEAPKLILEFHRIEQGNRVTAFNIDGLLLNLRQLFEKYRIKDVNGAGPITSA